MCGSMSWKKNYVFNTLKQFRIMVEKRISKITKCLRMDNGSEFTSLEFKKYCK